MTAAFDESSPSFGSVGYRNHWIFDHPSKQPALAGLLFAVSSSLAGQPLPVVAQREKHGPGGQRLVPFSSCKNQTFPLGSKDVELSRAAMVGRTKLMLCEVASQPGMHVMSGCRGLGGR